MPRIIEYDEALAQLRREGLVCNYHNSGAFAFADAERVQVRGWIGKDDPTIRPEYAAMVRRVAEPYAPTLAGLARRFCEARPAGEAWVMPMSHWAYELQFGQGPWLAELLEAVGVPAELLAGRNNASPVAFGEAELEDLERLLGGLLADVRSSDFVLLPRARAAICTIHHHQQLWWMTTRGEIVQELDGMV